MTLFSRRTSLGIYFILPQNIYYVILPFVLKYVLTRSNNNKNKGKALGFLTLFNLLLNIDAALAAPPIPERTVYMAPYFAPYFVDS